MIITDWLQAEAVPDNKLRRPASQQASIESSMTSYTANQSNPHSTHTETFGIWKQCFVIVRPRSQSFCVYLCETILLIFPYSRKQSSYFVSLCHYKPSLRPTRQCVIRHTTTTTCNVVLVQCIEQAVLALYSFGAQLRHRYDRSKKSIIARVWNMLQRKWMLSLRVCFQAKNSRLLCKTGSNSMLHRDQC